MNATTINCFRAGTIAAMVLLAGCGGGGGGGTPAATAPAPVAAATTYTASAMVGELLTYTLDTTNLTYSYTITDSQYGLNGKTGSGTLTRNSDGTYAPAGLSNAKIAILPNGLLLGAIRENFKGTPTIVPILGTSNPVTSLTGAQGTYNFIASSCLSGVCAANYGTFKLDPAGTWSSCFTENLAVACSSANARSGTLNSLGGGAWQILAGATNIGTALVFASGGQNVMILDLKDSRVGGYGIGILVGATQQAMTTGQTNGTWVAAGTNGRWATFTASGNQISYSLINGVATTATTTFTADSPWIGLATTSVPANGHGLLAGTGVYAFENPNGYVEIGIKIN